MNFTHNIAFCELIESLRAQNMSVQEIHEEVIKACPGADIIFTDICRELLQHSLYRPHSFHENAASDIISNQPYEIAQLEKLSPKLDMHHETTDSSFSARFYEMSQQEKLSPAADISEDCDNDFLGPSDNISCAAERLASPDQAQVTLPSSSYIRLTDGTLLFPVYQPDTVLHHPVPIAPARPIPLLFPGPVHQPDGTLHHPVPIAPALHIPLLSRAWSPRGSLACDGEHAGWSENCDESVGAFVRQSRS